jgi:hypothetical protein
VWFVKIKKGQDRNPAHFKIQYPMKNHNNICKSYTKFNSFLRFKKINHLYGKNQQLMGAKIKTLFQHKPKEIKKYALIFLFGEF